MKQGIKTIQNLYGELERQRAARKDLIADTRSITVNSVNGLSMLTVVTDSDKLSYRISEIAHRQIADRLGIPYKYYERMRQENPVLLFQFGLQKAAFHLYPMFPQNRDTFPCDKRIRVRYTDHHPRYSGGNESFGTRRLLAMVAARFQGNIHRAS